MPDVCGRAVLGEVRTGGCGEHVQAKDSVTGEALPPSYGGIDLKQLSEATDMAVSSVMPHGGHFSATTASQYTSVGARAVDRFLRPVCLQDMPADLVPDWARVS